MKFAVAAAFLVGGEGLRSGSRASLTSCGLKGTTVSNVVNISIVNGQDASECEWRWQVGLRQTESPQLPFCGGMLINEEWVLTAAHCGNRPNFYVAAGDYKPKIRGQEQVRKVVQVINHPDYTSSPVTRWDFSLVRLESPMEFNNCVGSVCLPDAGADLPDGTACWITGWGTLQAGGRQPDVLQEAEVNILSNKQCRDTGYTDNQIGKSMICAQGKTPAGKITDACQGDSGGPLVCENDDGVWSLHGATSWGRGCAGENYPGIWARVTEARDWIDETLAANVGPPPEPLLCPEFAVSAEPDRDGDCQCRSGKCYDGDSSRPNCLTSGGVAPYGGSYFLPGCAECRCK